MSFDRARRKDSRHIEKKKEYSNSRLGEDPISTQEKSKFQSLSELLETLNERGKFGASAIASEDGLIMAENIRNGLSREVLAAVSALVFVMGQRTQDYLKLKTISSIGFESPFGRILFHPITIRKAQRKMNLILTVIEDNKTLDFKERLNIFLFKRSTVENLLNWAKQSIIQIFNMVPMDSTKEELLKMGKYSVNVCEKCKRRDIIPFSQIDINQAKESGGLFIKILDHGDHIITLKIDPNGAVRREIISQK